MVEHPAPGFKRLECGKTVKEDEIPLRKRKKFDNKGPCAGIVFDREGEPVERSNSNFSNEEIVEEAELVKIVSDQKKRVPEGEGPVKDHFTELREDLVL